MADEPKPIAAAKPQELGAAALTTAAKTCLIGGSGIGRRVGSSREGREPSRQKVSYGNRNYFQRHNERLSLAAVKSVDTRRNLRQQQMLNSEAVSRLGDATVLLPESEGDVFPEGLEKSYNASQRDLVSSVDLGTQQKAFQLNLSFGPYNLNSSRNGRHLLAGGKKGCISLLDLSDMRLLCDVNVQQTVRDVQLLHNHTLWAAAQKKYLHIYDQQGVEVHCLRDHMLPYCLDFLPYHFLLVSIGEFGELSYLDVSTGQVAVRHQTKRGPCHCLRQNPENGVVYLGHSRGTVSLWTPNIAKPAVEMLSHKGGVTALAVNGNYFVTAGADGFWKVWDNRKFESFNEFRHFGTAPNSLDCSQSGLIALGMGSHVQIWKDAFKKAKPKMPFLTHAYQTQVVESVRFRPFEDLCFTGTSHGFGTLLVPGAGKANIDSLECNPFETKTQRRESEIRSLLEKLQPDMISLNGNQIGCVDRAPRAVVMGEARKEAEEKKLGKVKPKRKTRGRQGAIKRKQARLSKYAEALRTRAKQRTTKCVTIPNRGGTFPRTPTEVCTASGNTRDSFGSRRALDRFRKKT